MTVKRYKILTFLFAKRLFFILIILFISESVLRRIVYAPTKDQGEDVSMFEILPQFVKDYLQKLENIERLEQDLKKENDIAKRREVYYELVQLHSGYKQQRLLEVIIQEDPLSYDVSKAWAQLIIIRKDKDLIYGDYMDYLQKAKFNNPRQKAEVWQTGWNGIAKENDDFVFPFLKKMAEYHVIGSTLNSAYSRLWGIALAKKDKDLTKYAEQLEKQCEEMLKAEIKRNSQQ